MKTPSVEKTVRRLVGHLLIDSSEEKKQLTRLYTSLDRSDLTLDSKHLCKSSLSIEKADLFFDESIPKKRLEDLRVLAEKQVKPGRQNNYRMFVRDTPVQELLLHEDQAVWSAGSRVDHSIGPFRNKDGRNIWFDFYPIVKLVAVYMHGVAEPVMLCNISRVRDPETPRRLYEYTIVKGTTWINSHFLSSTAPVGSYVGLKVKSGNILLNKKPTIQSEKITISPDTRGSFSLDLEQSANRPGRRSGLGADARQQQLALPGQLKFHFTAQAVTIDSVGAGRWSLYGQNIRTSWEEGGAPVYNPILKRLVFPLKSSAKKMKIGKVLSPFNIITGESAITSAGWTLPVATINTEQPTEALGNGEFMIQTGQGFSESWKNLVGGSFFLNSPVFIGNPYQIVVADITKGNPHALFSLDLWNDDLAAATTKAQLTFGSPALFLYVCMADGHEVLATSCDGDFQIDRPVKVNGEPPAVKSRSSLLIMNISDAEKNIGIYDDNLLFDAVTGEDDELFESIALALTNGLFTTTKANGCLLFGTFADDYLSIQKGSLFLTFGLIGYLPTLPDPYAANLGVIKNQYKGYQVNDTVSFPTLFCWLVCRIGWTPSLTTKQNDDVDVSFHFAPLGSQFSGVSIQPEKEDNNEPGAHSVVDLPTLDSRYSRSIYPNLQKSTSELRSEIGTILSADNDAARLKKSPLKSNEKIEKSTTRAMSMVDRPKAIFEDQWDTATQRLRRSIFSLLDVSSAADLQGISFDHTADLGGFITTHVPAEISGFSQGFPLQIKNMEVTSKASHVKAFTVPQISWEPLINLTEPAIGYDPPIGPNYYPNDGGPTQIINSGQDSIALAPLPLNQYLVTNLGDEAPTGNFQALSLMTLPFGLKALALFKNEYSYTDSNGQTRTRKGTRVRFNSEDFDNNLKGGLQLQVDGGEAIIKDQSDMFVGSCVQLTNVLDFGGTLVGNTLGQSVSEIFNNEFLLSGQASLLRDRGVPLTRIDLSGYGASTFSNWLNPAAAFAETSQAKFDVIVGRCAHEIIQVKSIIYPWGIKVVRTITIFRVGSGYVYRFDSGWKAESNGKYDFRYYITEDTDPEVKKKKASPFEIHPGIVEGLYNVNNIVETEEIDPFEGVSVSEKIINSSGFYVDNPDPQNGISYKLQPVYFDADILIDNPSLGFVVKEVGGSKLRITPSKKVVGFVQVEPRGMPISKEVLQNLVNRQRGAISGPLDCEVNLAGSMQKMRLSRFDFSNSYGANGSDAIFAVAGRGNMLLPGDGSWSVVMHDRGSGEVTPVLSDKSVPVIREGHIVDKDLSEDEHQSVLEITPKAADVLLKVTNPIELLRPPVDATINYGFLQSTETQKALILNPSFMVNRNQLLSKNPVFFADCFRIVNSKAIFPNAGNGDNDKGNAISLMEDSAAFSTTQIQGEAVYEIMDLVESNNNPLELGYKLLKKVGHQFELPTTYELIDLGDGIFRIYLEYSQGGNEGKLSFDINSAKQELGERWKSHMSNLGIVVDLAGIDRLMTVRGNWKSQKGIAASYPEPDIVFADELQPVIDILEILQQLQGGDYGEALQNGLKLAMSNKAGTWEYKFEASKEIPVLRFPVPDEVYNNPNTPLKLEAGLTLGAYFNSAVKITAEGGELLPSAGGFLGFYGRLSVMCASLSVGTIYAIGQVNLEIAADTQLGPSLRMKFGFGAQLVIGLPVAGHVSVLYVVGVEIFAAKGMLEVSAFMLFEGHAEILGGIVSITIRIEAKGTVSKKLISQDPDVSRTDLTCQVTFGLDISIFLVINISFEESWSEQRQIA